MNTKHHMVQISVFFKKTKFTALNSIYFYFKTLAKRMLVFFEKEWRKAYNVGKIICNLRIRL